MKNKSWRLVPLLVFFLIPALGQAKEAIGWSGFPPPLLSLRLDGEASTVNLGPRFIIPTDQRNMSIDFMPQLGLGVATEVSSSSSYLSLQLTSRVRYDVKVYGNFQPYFYFGGLGLDYVISYPNPEDDVKEWKTLHQPLDLRLEMIGGGAEWQAGGYVFSFDSMIGYGAGLPRGTLEYPKIKKAPNKYDSLYNGFPYLSVNFTIWNQPVSAPKAKPKLGL